MGVSGSDNEGLERRVRLEGGQCCTLQQERYNDDDDDGDEVKVRMKERVA